MIDNLKILIENGNGGLEVLKKEEIHAAITTKRPNGATSNQWFVPVTFYGGEIGVPGHQREGYVSSFFACQLPRADDGESQQEERCQLEEVYFQERILCIY